jgi:hypothetical protein
VLDYPGPELQDAAGAEVFDGNGDVVDPAG